MQEFESKAEERRGPLRIAVGTTDEVNVLDHAIYDVGFVDGETLVFPEVAVDYALADGLFHDVGWVETIWSEGARRAALVEEALFVCAVVV